MKPKPEDLTEVLRRLSLTTIAQHYEDLGREAAREGLSHVEYLRRLAEAEAAARYERSVQRRTQAARLPVLKTLEQFDWSWPRKINRVQVQDLFRLRFVEQNTNVVFIAGVGLGKTHLAVALAHDACLHNVSTLFAPAVEIVNTLSAAQATNTLSKALKAYVAPRLLVVDRHPRPPHPPLRDHYHRGQELPDEGQGVNRMGTLSPAKSGTFTPAATFSPSLLVAVPSAAPLGAGLMFSACLPCEMDC